ncbi:TPA: hypothetical protein KD839_000162 [Vibrio parahaemolyticus]|nr:hypothetical protein [Vibrio parahaemolyticus]
MKKISNVLRNSILLYFRMVIGLLVSLYISRVSLDILGVDSFGLYTIIASFVIVGGVIVNVATTSMQRHLSESIGVEVNKSLSYKSNRVLNACVIVNSMLGLLSISLILLFGTVYINSFLNQDIVAVNVVWNVFYVSIATFFVSFITSPYLTLLISYEDARYYSLIMMLEVLTKLVFILCMYMTHAQNILVYSIAVFISMIITRLSLICIVKLRYKNTKLSFHYDWETVKPILSFTGWNLWGGIASVMSLQGVSFLINAFFDLQVNAARAISLQIFSAVTQLVNSIQLAIAPQLVKSNDQKDGYFSDLFILSGKITVYLSFIVSFILFENTQKLLDLWLGDYPVITVIFLKFTYIEVMLISLSYPILSVVQADGNIKRYQLVVGGFMILNIPIMYLMVSLKGNYEYIYIVSILISALSLTYRLIYAKKIIGSVVDEYLKSVIGKGILVLFLSLSASQMIRFEALLLNMFTNGTIFTILFFLIMLSSKEKGVILSRIKVLRVK